MHANPVPYDYVVSIILTILPLFKTLGRQKRLLSTFRLQRTGMKKSLLLFLCALYVLAAHAQTDITIHLSGEAGKPLAGATVHLLRARDSSLLKLQVADNEGKARFNALPNGAYIAKVNSVGYDVSFQSFSLPGETEIRMPLALSAKAMSGVVVTARKPLVELQPGKTVVNLENSITQVGATVLEALEKMPGITIDKDGNIGLKGKNSVTVMLDGRPVYINGAELNTLLSGMSASGISQVELIDQPSARYDAAGNAGIINIKTKKIQQKGFYGSASVAASQGVYPKGNSSLQLNYRSGKWNLFSNYSLNANRGFMRIDAERTYLGADETTVLSKLNQPTYAVHEGVTHNLRTGVDYSINQKTGIGLTLTGVSLQRDNRGNNEARWLNPQGVLDSLVTTRSNNTSRWKNGSANFNFRHAFSSKKELTADVDWIGYRIRASQLFDNIALSPVAYVESSRAFIPTGITIRSAKVDYTTQLGQWKWEMGAKTSRIKTDNLSDFELNDGSGWKQDLGRTNHFLYTENIHAAYLSGQAQMKQWTLQGGLRFEATHLDAHQLGNAVVKDSSFSRSYNGLFPTVMVSLAADSNHTFSISAGRRIDRPPFQKLNPFQIIINKYTYQQGNPFYRPQYTWNMELAHSYKNVLLTGIGYSVTTDFFSQVFPVLGNGIIIYTEGNLEKLQVFTLSLGTQLHPTSWWNLSAQGVINHRKMKGFIGKVYDVSFTQFNLNLNNQFRFKKGWGAELTGFYSSKGRNDIQEIVDPAGQLSIGVSKSVMQNKGSLKLAVRDIFYTQWMKGFTYFERTTEWFKLTRDTRIVTLSFSYRFGKAFKASKRSSGGAKEETERVGNG